MSISLQCWNKKTAPYICGCIIMVSPKVYIEIASLDGHRGSYLKFFCKLFDGARTQSIAKMLFAKQPVFFITLEGSFGLYAFVASVRALVGRRTVGLLLRPLPAVEGRSLRLRAKRLVLKILRRISAVQTLTILPFSVEPRFASIADGWIYDPQLWDLNENDRKSVANGGGPLTREIHKVACGRRVCIALGRQDLAKGFNQFVQFFCSSQELRKEMLFAYGGRVNNELSFLANNFDKFNGFALNRYVADEEILDLYAASDLVWCVYDSNYDQASGIFGRAFQLGIPVMVRRNSLVHRMCQLENFPHLDIDDETDISIFSSPRNKKDSELMTSLINKFRCESLSTLKKALDLNKSITI